MDFTIRETIYVVEMTNVVTNVTTTLRNAYASLDAAYDLIEECKREDKRVGSTACWTYRVKYFTLFR